MKTWKLEVEISISNNWVDDGFDLEQQDENIENKLRDLLPWANEWEIDVKNIQINEIR